jgi:hypothetical protein
MHQCSTTVRLCTAVAVSLVRDLNGAICRDILCVRASLGECQDLSSEFPALTEKLATCMSKCTPAGSEEASATVTRASASSAGGLRLQEFVDGKSTDGVAALRKAGFDVEETVGKKGDESIWKITDVAGQDGKFNVVLVPFGSTSGICGRVALNAFVGMYEKRAASSVVALHDGWPTKATSASASYSLRVAKSIISSAIALCGRSMRATSLVQIYAKPQRSVRATEMIPKTALALVPETFKVSHATGSDILPTNACIVGFDGRGHLDHIEDVKFYLTSAFSDDFVCPAWAVRSTSDVDKANMVWKTVDVSDVAVVTLPAEARRRRAS